MFDDSLLKPNFCISWGDESVIVPVAEVQLSDSQVLNLTAGSCHSEWACE